MLLIPNILSLTVTIEQFYYALMKISFGSLFIPLISSILNYKALSTTFRALFFYFIITIIIEALTFFLAGKQIKIVEHQSIAILFSLANAFTILQFCTFAFLYFNQFTGRKIKYLIKLVTTLYLIFSAIVFFLFGKFTHPDNLTTVVEGIILWSLSVYFYFHIFQEMTIPKLSENSFVWINSGVLIYFSVALVLFLADDYLETCSKNIFRVLWSLHLISNILFNLLSGIGIWKQRNLA